MHKILAVLALAVGVSSVQAQSPAPDPKPVPPIVVVENDAPIAATVYVVDRGAKIRLGIVTATQRGTFKLPDSGAPASFYVQTSRGSYTTNAVQNVRAGDRLVLRISPEVALSYATR